jgi:hypothetical protein
MKYFWVMWSVWYYLEKYHNLCFVLYVKCFFRLFGSDLQHILHDVFKNIKKLCYPLQTLEGYTEQMDDIPKATFWTQSYLRTYC